MRVECARPPLFDEIDAAFKIAGKPVIFAWGDVIYNPCRIEITPELFTHEAVHHRQQREGGGPETWWRRYIADEAFRLEQEIPAHAAEYAAFCQTHLKGNARNQRRLYFHSVASRLSSPLYGGLIRYEEARRLLKQHALAAA
jgi:hypothetical protein